ncbi:MAG: hypothetical protein HY611_03000 [Elusimicrobia bacterium]|nr:hypothetical protein [Elusimicrobiota bacterium]
MSENYSDFPFVGQYVSPTKVLLLRYCPALLFPDFDCFEDQCAYPFAYPPLKEIRFRTDAEIDLANKSASEEARREGRVFLHDFFEHERDLTHSMELVVVDPRVELADPDGLKKLKHEVEARCEREVILTLDDIANRAVIPINVRQEIDEEWQHIRDEAIKKLSSERPEVGLFLTRTENEALVSKIREYVLSANKNRISKKYRDAIRDAGWACEKLLLVLCPQSKATSVRRKLDEEKDSLIKVLGFTYYKALENVYRLRNRAEHGTKEISSEEAQEAYHDIARIFDRYVSITGGSPLSSL